jgi:plastocyanin
MTTAQRLVLTAIATSAAVASLGAASQTISQADRSFAPGAVTVKAGDSLVFKNDDVVTHNAFSTSKGNEFNSKAQEPGQSATIALKTAGTVEVRCAFHPKMRMTITVQ